VESPNKIKKIKSFVNNTFNVSASCGHIRNMDPKCMSIDINDKTDTFNPIYIVVSDKKKVVSELSKLVKSLPSDGTVYLAMDFDREGEAIAWHLNEVLKLKKSQTKRITFTEITKKAILTAIDNPTDIDMNMFYSQQARMVLDKLIGYMISPILWKQFSNYKLSAGRVQSVVVKIINERETEIAKFQSSNFFKITSNFWIDKSEHDFKTAVLSTILENEIKSKEQLDIFLKYIPIDEKPTDIQKQSTFNIESTKTNQTKRKPSPPFITSTLQQEASIKLSMNPKSCMSSAQKLYENGLITYMRTDSTVLSDDAHKSISDTIVSKYGVVYYNKVVYKSKSKTSQEAHEAIRPTHFEKETIIGENSKLNSYDNKLYQLIWKRTIASQMKPADVEITTLKIKLQNDNLDAKCKETNYIFAGKFEKILFDGYLKLMTPSKSVDKEDKEDKEDEGTHKKGKVVSELILKKLKKLKKGDNIYIAELNALEKHSKPPKSRFTEASLIKRLDELEIGRPSTYAAVVSKVQDKLYVENKTVPPIKKEFINIDLKYPNTKNETTKKVSVDGEKNKLFVTPLGYMTNEYLEKQFSNILDYSFTANVETLLDEIAKGNKVWNIVVGEVYKTFNPTVEKIMISLKSMPNSSASSKFETIELGLHPDNGVPIIVINTKYGPAVVLNYEEKTERKYGNFNGSLTDMTLENAVKLLEYPKTLGSYKDSPIILNKRQNYYLTYKKKNYSIDNYNKQFENTDSDSDDDDDDNTTGTSIQPTKIKCETISLEESIKVIEYLMKSIVDDIQITKDILIKKGPYGFYIKYKTKINVAIIYKYKKQYTTFEKMKSMTLEECNECIEKHSNKSKTSTNSTKPYKKKK